MKPKISPQQQAKELLAIYKDKEKVEQYTRMLADAVCGEEKDYWQDVRRTIETSREDIL